MRKTKWIVWALLLGMLCGMMGMPASAQEVPIKWSGTISCAPYLGGPPENDEVSPYIEGRLREYGIDLKYELVYLERTQYTQLLNLRLASGDAPDVFYNNSMATQAEYYAQGVVASWTEDFFREVAPNVARIFDEGGPNGMTKGQEVRTWAMTKASDGMMMTIPIIYFANNTQKDIMYNGLWVEKLGLTEATLPTNLDEFEALMRRFVTEDPDGDGQADTYGFSASMFPVIYGAYGVMPGQWMLEEDGSLLYGSVKPGVKEALEKLAYYYKEGLIDPEFVTGENAGGHWGISHAIANGYIGVTHLAGYHHFMTGEEKELLTGVKGTDSNNALEIRKVQGPEAYFCTGPALIGPHGDVGVSISAASSSVNSLYNAQMDQDKLGACLAIMDAFAQDEEMALSARFGIPGRDWYFEDKPDGTKKAVLLYTMGDATTKVGGSLMRNLYGPGDVINDDYYKYLSESFSDILACIWTREKGPNRDVGYTNPVFAPIDSVTQYMADLNTYTDELFTKIIRGEASVDAFDAYVTYWYANGGQTMTDDVNAWYKTLQ